MPQKAPSKQSLTEGVHLWGRYLVMFVHSFFVMTGVWSAMDISWVETRDIDEQLTITGKPPPNNYSAQNVNFVKVDRHNTHQLASTVYVNSLIACKWKFTDCVHRA